MPRVGYVLAGSEPAECLVGHSGTSTTETVYRKQIRPLIIESAGAMDRIFPSDGQDV